MAALRDRVRSEHFFKQGFYAPNATGEKFSSTARTSQEVNAQKPNLRRRNQKGLRKRKPRHKTF